jgi:hypothetical protein
MGSRWNVRRFAALDMHGTAGTLRRRRIVTAEFILGTVALVLVGARSPGYGGWLLATWLLGCSAARRTTAHWLSTPWRCTRQGAWRRNWKALKFALSSVATAPLRSSWSSLRSSRSWPSSRLSGVKGVKGAKGSEAAGRG